MRKSEAKKKMCPLGRKSSFYAGFSVSINMDRGEPYAKCITDKCMAWKEINDIEGYCQILNR